ncbi:MAG TPA: dihydropteroate synthase [Aeromicrobium sp.]|nr:dihydropteroate synthase [Aeromicrobium sp.]
MTADPLQPIGRTRVMGVINVTPDSFSDGGQWMDADAAVKHGLDLVAEGADLVDVGGESTRPGAIRIDAAEELSRIIPVVQALAGEGVIVSVDTMRAEVAEAALAAGARMINDVSGGRADPDMFAVAAAAGVPTVIMHWRGHSTQMQNLTAYDHLVPDVIGELTEQVEAALAAGVSRDRIIVDPGLGFSKTGEQNWTVLSQLDRFIGLGFPLLVAASRKRFLGELLGDRAEQRPVEDRESATVAISTLAAQAGVWAVRVHEPKASADAVRVVARIQEELA